MMQALVPVMALGSAMGDRPSLFSMVCVLRDCRELL